MTFSISAVSCCLLLLVRGYRVHCFAPRLALAPSRHYTYALTRPRPRTGAGADIEQETEQPLPPTVETDEPPARTRGKVNEIDFCIAPADVSLSRSYSSTTTQSTSLTRALNNASNRAVRRILLARSWPSVEALNISLRQVLAADSKLKGSNLDMRQEAEDDEEASPKCPVPRPILNILVRRDKYSTKTGIGQEGAPVPRSRTDEEYVADQLTAFFQRHGTIPGYEMAEAYLECILSLATSGVESPRVQNVMQAGVYDESYRRMVAVLKSVGAVFEEVPGTSSQQVRIAQKLVDQDICLSMLDKMNMKREIFHVEIPSQSKVAKQETTTLENVDTSTETDEEKTKTDSKIRLQFWKKTHEQETPPPEQDDSEQDFELDASDLGGVLLSAEEPSLTRQLNVLANIVQRALLFGGDEELLVLSETLDADKTAFVKKWYPGPNGEVELASPEEETRPGVQFLNCLVFLLKECYKNGVVSALDPLLPLPKSYANAYERLMASLVELGSGYISPKQNVMTMPIPRTAQEELGRFAVWESTFRSKNTPAYPQDLVGSWQVQDEIGGETIGITTLVFEPEGKVHVALPMQGLRWRLDPGPTHLDTITFQVLGDDGTILQYRGFIDRGARLEARFSKRRVRIRGSVMFQMRYGDGAYLGDGYWKDMLPINYKTGTTKFVMTKN